MPFPYSSAARRRAAGGGLSKSLVNTFRESGALGNNARIKKSNVIWLEYNDYKSAAKRAGKASQASKTKRNHLRDNRTPYQEMYQLAPLAAAASESANI